MQLHPVVGELEVGTVVLEGDSCSIVVRVHVDVLVEDESIVRAEDQFVRGFECKCKTCCARAN